MTNDSDLETSLSESVDKPKTVQCRCAHGPCRNGESKCSGNCDKGWTGPNCDTPTADRAVMDHLNKNRRKDFTGDGLYRPQAIVD